MNRPEGEPGFAPKAAAIKTELCDCGCGGILVQLIDEEANVLAFGTISDELADQVAVDLRRKAIIVRNRGLPNPTHQGGHA